MTTWQICRIGVALGVLLLAACEGGSSSREEPKALAWVVGDERDSPAALILRSPDGGASWEVSLRDHEGPLDAIDFVNGDVGWAVGNGDVFHTDDSGASWVNQAQRIEGRPTILLDVDFIDDHRGVIVGTEFPDPPTDLSGAPVSFVTEDGGSTWRSSLIVDRGQSIERARIRLTAVCIGSEGLGYASGLGLDGRLFLTTSNYGGTWEAIETPPPGAAIACIDGAIWAVGGDGESTPRLPRIFQSLDGGRTWRDRSSGIEPKATGALRAVGFASDARGCAGGIDRTADGVPVSLVLETGDAGVTWTSALLPPATQGLSLRGIACAASGRTVAVADDERSGVPDGSTALYSAGDGQWFQVAMPDDVATVRDVSLVESSGEL